VKEKPIWGKDMKPKVKSGGMTKARERAQES